MGGKRGCNSEKFRVWMERRVRLWGAGKGGELVSEKARYSMDDAGGTLRFNSLMGMDSGKTPPTPSCQVSARRSRSMFLSHMSSDMIQ